MNLSLYLLFPTVLYTGLLSQKLESKRQKRFGLNLIGRQEHAIFVIQPNATVTPAVVVASITILFKALFITYYQIIM